MSSPEELSYLEIGASSEEAELCVILMHGLGANGHDFEDVAAMLCEAATPKRWRFILPHAPDIPVTINMGMNMPAWYDILDLSHPREVNWDTIATSQQQIESLMKHETAEKMILAGFSQGAAMALQVGLRHQDQLSGVLLMSGYLLESATHPVPPCETDLPIGIFHGSHDEVVPIHSAETTVLSLNAAGYSPTFKSYTGLAHSVSDEEIRDVFEWLMTHGS